MTDDEKFKLADCPDTPAHILAQLAKDNYEVIRSYVALNPSTPFESLLELAKDADYSVILSVAQNPNTPLEILTELAKEDDVDIQEELLSRYEYIDYMEEQKSKERVDDIEELMGLDR